MLCKNHLLTSLSSDFFSFLFSRVPSDLFSSGFFSVQLICSHFFSFFSFFVSVSFSSSRLSSSHLFSNHLTRLSSSWLFATDFTSYRFIPILLSLCQLFSVRLSSSIFLSFSQFFSVNVSSSQLISALLKQSLHAFLFKTCKLKL